MAYTQDAITYSLLNHGITEAMSDAEMLGVLLAAALGTLYHSRDGRRATVHPGDDRLRTWLGVDQHALDDAVAVAQRLGLWEGVSSPVAEEGRAYHLVADLDAMKRPYAWTGDARPWGHAYREALLKHLVRFQPDLTPSARLLALAHAVAVNPKRPSDAVSLRLARLEEVLPGVDMEAAGEELLIAGLMEVQWAHRAGVRHLEMALSPQYAAEVQRYVKAMLVQGGYGRSGETDYEREWMALREIEGMDRAARRRAERGEIEKHALYALVDPRTMEARWIGESTDLDERLRTHLERPGSAYYTSNSPKDAWVSELMERGTPPLLVRLSPGKEMEEREVWKHERAVTQALFAMGAPLLNRQYKPGNEHLDPERFAARNEQRAKRSNDAAEPRVHANPRKSDNPVRDGSIIGGAS